MAQKKSPLLTISTFHLVTLLSHLNIHESKVLAPKYFTVLLQTLTGNMKGLSKDTYAMASAVLMDYLEGFLEFLVQLDIEN
jgi:hypothetical protein